MALTSKVWRLVVTFQSVPPLVLIQKPSVVPA
jgi:hypothetical protein